MLNLCVCVVSCCLTSMWMPCFLPVAETHLRHLNWGVCREYLKCCFYIMEVLHFKCSTLTITSLESTTWCVHSCLWFSIESITITLKAMICFVILYWHLNSFSLSHSLLSVWSLLSVFICMSPIKDEMVPMSPTSQLGKRPAHRKPGGIQWMALLRSAMLLSTDRSSRLIFLWTCEWLRRRNRLSVHTLPNNIS